MIDLEKDNASKRSGLFAPTADAGAGCPIGGDEIERDLSPKTRDTNDVKVAPTSIRGD
jgi:hypothetical protein